jgi:hypothetical protein
MDKAILPSKDRKYLVEKQLKFREVTDGAKNGLIIDDFLIQPDGKFSVEKSSLLIILPIGYPDVPPDMFYFIPELRLKFTGSYPAQADQFPVHFSQKWQQWSRHAPIDQWRVGKDGIQSYLQRVFTALNTAS